LFNQPTVEFVPTSLTTPEPLGSLPLSMRRAQAVIVDLEGVPDGGANPDGGSTPDGGSGPPFDAGGTDGGTGPGEEPNCSRHAVGGSQSRAGAFRREHFDAACTADARSAYSEHAAVRVTFTCFAPLK
jgi:hypothetical protein